MLLQLDLFPNSPYTKLAKPYKFRIDDIPVLNSASMFKAPKNGFMESSQC